METTAEELKWAIAIKEAAFADPEIDCDSFCDLDYLQHGIVAKDRIDKAICRLRNLQKVKRRYGIKAVESVDESMRDITTFLRENPGLMLSLASFEDQSHVVCAATIELKASKFKSEESFAIAMRLFYHVLQASNPNIAAIRSGLVFLINCKGSSLTNFSASLEGSLVNLYSRAYPIRLRLSFSVGASFLIRMLFTAILKLFATKKVREKHYFGPATSFFPPEITPEVLPVEWDGKLTAECLEKTLRRNLTERYLLAQQFKL